MPINRLLTTIAAITAALLPASPLAAADGDRLIAEYFRAETAKLTDAALADIDSKEDWQQRRPELHRQLRDMLGLDPWPERTPLEPRITGRVEHDDFTVEKLHFQSLPGLYVTANLYLPKDRRPDEEPKKLPAILYVCGHGRVKQDGVSYGNKTHYQHHGGWFARNGYACLTIDTIQLGEIEGLHHGTHNLGLWWWHSRGYTPAGVEAWNGIRAIDYLQSRPEVDGDRIGVTGRSGGGAYSWWVAALDERIKVAVPVAGITSLKNHVVDGCIEGHCDCMFMLNTYRWDFPMLAALVAPRPLLISNTDKDPIFPLDGVVDVYTKTRRIYKLLGAEKKIGLQITEGPHADTQELRIHAFHWFNKHLKGQNPSPLIEMAAVKFFEPAELKVFPKNEQPADEIVTTIQESFVSQATPARPKDEGQWNSLAEGLKKQLREQTFRGWPEKADTEPLRLEPTFTATHGEVTLRGFEFTSQEPFRLPLYVAHRKGLDPEELDLVVLNVLDEDGWQEFLSTMRPGFADRFDEATDEAAKAAPDQAAFDELEKMLKNFKWGMAYVPPRGVGPTAWTSDKRERTHIRRRFALLGQSLPGMQVFDAVRAAEALRSAPGMKDVPLWMQGERDMAAVTLYAALFTPQVQRLDLWQLTPTHASTDSPDFLNVLRFLDVPQAVALAARDAQIVLYGSEPTAFDWARQVTQEFADDPKPLQFRPLPGESEE